MNGVISFETVSFGALLGVTGFLGVVGSVSMDVQSVGGADVVDFGVLVGLNVGLVLGRVVVGTAVTATRGVNTDLGVTVGTGVLIDMVVGGRVVVVVVLVALVRAVVVRVIATVGGA